MSARCRMLAFILAMGVVATGSGRTAEAQSSYPDRLIKVIVPFAPGGPVDIVARLITPQLQAILGQSVIIENRAGAASALGSKAAAHAEHGAGAVGGRRAGLRSGGCDRTRGGEGRRGDEAGDDDATHESLPSKSGPPTGESCRTS